MGGQGRPPTARVIRGGEALAPVSSERWRLARQSSRSTRKKNDAGVDDVLSAESAADAKVRELATIARERRKVREGRGQGVTKEAKSVIWGLAP